MKGAGAWARALHISGSRAGGFLFQWVPQAGGTARRKRAVARQALCQTSLPRLYSGKGTAPAIVAAAGRTAGIRSSTS